MWKLVLGEVKLHAKVFRLTKGRAGSGTLVSLTA